MASSRPAIVLTSGGIDSTTCLAIAREQGFEPLYSMTFDYGQRHRSELEAAQRVAEFFRVAEHRVIRIDLRQFGHSALTADIDVPKDRSGFHASAEIPITYVPARNTIFLSYCLAWSEVLAVRDVFIGVNAVDYSGYPDCRPEFIAAFERMANLATKMNVEAVHPRVEPKGYLSGEDLLGSEGEEGRSAEGQSLGADDPLSFKIHAPLIELTKGEIIRRGLELGVDYSMTRSCYDPDDRGRACGRCDSCLLRKKGFAAAGVIDPTRYVEGSR